MTSVSELCSDLPAVFIDHMNYVHNLRDEESRTMDTFEGCSMAFSGGRGSSMIMYLTRRFWNSETGDWAHPAAVYAEGVEERRGVDTTKQSY